MLNCPGCTRHFIYHNCPVHNFRPILALGRPLKLLIALAALVVVLAFVAPAKALLQVGYVHGYNGTTPIYPAKVYIRNNYSGAVGSTVSTSPYGQWVFSNIVLGTSYTYWATYQPYVCVHPNTVLRYSTSKFTGWAINTYGQGVWDVGHINLANSMWISC